MSEQPQATDADGGQKAINVHSMSTLQSLLCSLISMPVQLAALQHLSSIRAGTMVCLAVFDLFELIWAMLSAQVQDTVQTAVHGVARPNEMPILAKHKQQPELWKDG